ncbi:GAF domain-containing protein [Pleionea mediterranea]|uniref:GAF domain-containing protein n=1 Tax=Pleionea mediterranea TaxID=523701 RepID=A0A316FD61_9GAMM|nr:GAF domain-containing protein [Pleionea mediterranea]PWK44407.1 GAF domain-containing protein [Pleionea mediterranea]
MTTDHTTTKNTTASRQNDILQKIRDNLSMEMALFSHIYGNVYEVVSVVSEIPIANVGDKLDLNDCLCLQVLQNKASVYYHKINTIEELREHPVIQAMQPESYIGVPVYHSGEIFGTLSMLSLTPRSHAFTELEIEQARAAADALSATL